MGLKDREVCSNAHCFTLDVEDLFRDALWNQLQPRDIERLITILPTRAGTMGQFSQYVPDATYRAFEPIMRSYGLQVHAAQDVQTNHTRWDK
jgi:hypothetical protein